MDNQNKNNNSNNNRQGWGIILFTTLLVTFVVMALYSLMQGNDPEEISYDEFLELVDDGKVAEVNLGSNAIYITLKDDAGQNGQNADAQKDTTQENDQNTDQNGGQNSDQSQKESQTTDQGTDQNGGVNSLFQRLEHQSGDSSDPDYYTGYVSDDTLPQRLEDAGVKFGSEVPDTMSSLLFELFVTLILPIALLAILFSFLMRRMTKGGGMMGIGKSNAKVYMEKETGVTFQDVAGQDEAKESLQEVVDFLHNPGKYSGIGARLPKGALLVGPPGTGKTLLAKAVAGEAKVPFFSLSGSAFVEMYVE